VQPLSDQAEVEADLESDPQGNAWAHAEFSLDRNAFVFVDHEGEGARNREAQCAKLEQLELCTHHLLAACGVVFALVARLDVSELLEQRKPHAIETRDRFTDILSGK
jgi:hypothetical protein